MNCPTCGLAMLTERQHVHPYPQVRRTENAISTAPDPGMPRTRGPFSADDAIRDLVRNHTREELVELIVAQAGAAAQAEAASGLDAERLALALHEERADRWGGCGSPGEAYDDHMSFHQTRAERIAATYARLAQEQPK